MKGRRGLAMKILSVRPTVCPCLYVGFVTKRKKVLHACPEALQRGAQKRRVKNLINKLR